VGAAREAPLLDLVEGRLTALGVPVGRRDVRAVHLVQDRLVGAAALAGHGCTVPRSVSAVSSPVGVRSLTVAVSLLGLVLAAACGSGDEEAAVVTSTATSPTPSPPTSMATGTSLPATGDTGAGEAGAVLPVGFESVVARITLPDESVCEVCVWLADDGDRRGRGLMRVTDLGGRVGMAFAYDAPRTTTFTMRNTVLPLSIAFFGDGGAFIDAFDMAPCTTDRCPSYPTPPGFRVALEVPQGDLASLGIGAGSRLDLLDVACP
jgi:uncharacterized membrane protein (UPF0127 family)